MNKKLIKTLACVACGLGVVSSVPFISTSCGSSAEPTPESKIPCTTSDFKYDDESVIGFNEIGQSKLAEWKEQKLNLLELPVNNNTVRYCPKNEDSFNYHCLPTFIEELVIPKQIEYVNSYTHGEYTYLPAEIKKISFLETGIVTLAAEPINTTASSSYSLFDDKSILDTIIFAGSGITITSSDWSLRSSNSFFSNAGRQTNGECKVYITNKSLTLDQKKNVFNRMVSCGLNKEKWTPVYN